MPPRLPRCSAFSLHKSYSVSGSESETLMSIRLPSALIFMWRLFCWQCKWLKVEKDLSSSAAYFKYYVTWPPQQALGRSGCKKEWVHEKETREGSSSPLACLPLAHPSFLAPTPSKRLLRTSKHLLRRLYIITNYISRTAVFSLSGGNW